MLSIGQTKNKERIWSVPLFLLVVLLILHSSGCATPKRPPIPQKRMTLRIGSVPSGAEVYSYSDDALGSQLGTTPFAMEIGASLDFDGSNYFFWVYSPNDCVTATEVQSEAGTEYDLLLNCAIFAEGYNPKYVVNELINRCSVHHGIYCQEQITSLLFYLEPDMEKNSAPLGD
jgi:hypothetical protein